tara:strand:- start:143 stop:433 length:291 start_codon:yes stop_codon:yes gene_type:complete
MAKKTVAVSGSSFTTAVMYTCPSNTIAKVIGGNGHNDPNWKVSYSNGSLMYYFQRPEVSGPDRYQHVLTAGSTIRGHANHSYPWSLVIVEESVGVQ